MPAKRPVSVRDRTETVTFPVPSRPANGLTPGTDAHRCRWHAEPGPPTPGTDPSSCGAAVRRG
jgi:hypothetical protein